MDKDDVPARQLSDKEFARIRRRERRRERRMVVDNAGVKRVLQALALRRRRDGSGAPPRQPE